MVSDHLLDVLGDENARMILEAIAQEPLSVKELTSTIGISQPTVSRRLTELKSAGLVREETVIDSAGHHYNVYTASFEEATIRFENGNLDVSLTVVEDPVDRMARIFREVRGE